MSSLLVAGILFGAIVGILHAIQIIVARASGPGSMAKAMWHAIWFFALWTVFGPYVLAIWLIGAVLLALSRLVSAPRTERGTMSGARS